MHLFIPGHEAFLLQVQPLSFSPAHATVLILVIAFLLFLNALASGAKVAIFSLKAKDINYLKTKENSSSRRVIQLLERPRILFATIIALTFFLNISIVVTFHLLAQELLPVEMTTGLKLTIEVIVVTFIILLFGTVLPRVYGVQNNIRMAMFAAPALLALRGLFSPLAGILASSNTILDDYVSAEPTMLNTNEFEESVEKSMGYAAGAGEVGMFKGILRFGNIKARHVMVPRLEVKGIAEDATWPMVRKMITEEQLSRIPVFKDNLDQIIGMLNVKDLLPHLSKKDFRWQEMIRPAIFIPEDKMANELMKEFQTQKKQFAVIVDEFGGTSGIITMEDIIAEITGELQHEIEGEHKMFKQEDENTLLIDGRITIFELSRALRVAPDYFQAQRGESDTLAGLLIEYLGRFPQENETITIKEIDFTTIEVTPTRIALVKACIAPK